VRWLIVAAGAGMIVALLLPAPSPGARPALRERCPDARQAVVFYRAATWRRQTGRRGARTPTRHAERAIGCCYVRWAARLWAGRARLERKRLRVWRERRARGWLALASWYGPGLYGNTMACGGVLHPGSMVVAHRTLVCGTRLLVCYAGRCVDAVVQDRGPYVAGRDVDLGPGVARALGFGGVAVVRLSVRS
jgi:rare lipoprotein A (peptidoglycan hydrolase)